MSLPPELPSDDESGDTPLNKNSQSNALIKPTNNIVIKKRRPQTVKPPLKENNTPAAEESEESKEKVLVTGDDVLIEYVSRIIATVKVFSETDIPKEWSTAVDRFIQHYVWHTPCLLYTSPSPRDKRQSRMPSSA